MRPTVAAFDTDLSAPALRVRGLRLRVGGERVVADDLDLLAGELRLLRGAEHAHPALWRALLGLGEPERGAIAIGGVELGPLPVHERLLLRRRIGFVPREGALLANLGLDANLALLARHHLDLDGAALRARMEEVSALLELPPLVGRRLADAPPELERKVAIGRVLALRPPLLLLEEPTLGLDARRAAAMWAMLDALRRERGMAVLASGEEAAAGRRQAWRLAAAADGRPDREDDATEPDAALLSGDADAGGLTARVAMTGEEHAT